MRRCLCAFSAAATTFTFLVGPVAAQSPVIDQFYLPLVTLQSQARADDFAGQSFTVGVTGQLGQIKILMGRQPSASQDVDFYVFQVQGNTAQNVQRLTIPYQAIPLGGGVDTPANYVSRMLTVDLTSLEIPVRRGQQWGFAVTSVIPSGGPQINLFYGCDYTSIVVTCGSPGSFNGYFGGQRLQFKDFDMMSVSNSESAAFLTI
jgi:hypothetical protein